MCECQCSVKSEPHPLTLLAVQPPRRDRIIAEQTRTLMPQVKDTNVHVNIYTLKYSSQLLSCIARKQRTNKAPKRLGEGHVMPKNLGEQQKNGASKYSVQVCLHFECHCSVNHPVGSQSTFVAIVEVFLPQIHISSSPGTDQNSLLIRNADKLESDKHES